MDRFAVTESRTLFFHRILVDQIRHSPGLLERARAALPGLAARPAGDVWDRWAGLLAASFDQLAAAVLEDSPQGGLLRAHSPLMAVLSDDERNSLWQRVGLQQVVAYALAAAADLGLSLAEEAAALGDGTADWHRAPPATLTVEAMEPLKQIIAIQRALTTLLPDGDARRAWLRAPHPDFAARPLDILINGGGALVQHALAEAVRPRLDRGDLPSH
jgi:hypothetical protein